jgi:oligopeptide transport system permease protein
MAELSKDKFKIVGINKDEMDLIVRPNLTYWQDAWRRLKKNKVAMISLVALILLVILVLFGPAISGKNYQTQNLKIANQKPSGEFWFGTDNLGRDMFSRLWVGGRVSLSIAVIATLLEVVIGCIYGGISGYFGGKVDNVMMRIVEILNSIPYLIVVILFSVILGSGMVALLLALCVTAWTGMARMVRGQVLQLKESEYVMAARTLGASPMRIILKHMIPNTIGVIIVYITFDIPSFIFAEAFLSFVGLGIQPPETSWGAMVNAGQGVMEFYPYQLLIPALAISVTMLAFNLLGDGLRDALDPKMRQ